MPNHGQAYLLGQRASLRNAVEISMAGRFNGSPGEAPSFPWRPPCKPIDWQPNLSEESAGQWKAAFRRKSSSKANDNKSENEISPRLEILHHLSMKREQS